MKTYNAGMRGGKVSVHEGGTHVPLFMRWPAAKWMPHLVQEIAAHIDLLPTIMDLYDVKMNDSKPDGVSLKPLLQKTGSWPERTQRYRLVREIKGAAGGSKAKANDASATPWQLYDMTDDPGEAKDIAADHEDIVKQLSAQYDSWFADISSAGLQRFPLPIGHSEQNPVELNAPQSYQDKPLRFASGPGFANDWLTNWNNVKAKVWFEIDVATAGEYDLELTYACPPADAGSKLRMSIGDQSLEATIITALAPEIPLPHRDADGKTKYRNREWSTLKLGTLKLKRGPAKLMLEPLSMPGTQVMDLKYLKLTLR